MSVVTARSQRLAWLTRYRRGEMDDDHTESTSSSTDSDEDLGLKFARIENITRATDKPASAYKGFSTSISHSFVNTHEEQGDACALACCGMFQKDRNHYLLTGEPPPSWRGRLGSLVIIPSAILSIILIVARFHSMISWSSSIVTALLCVLLVYVGYLVTKSTVKRSQTRKELLRLKYQRVGQASGQNASSTYQGDEEEYMMGQTSRNLLCAHSLCGCYEDDVIYEDMEAPPPKDICHCLSRCFAVCFCGRCCGSYLQLCGICGVAQETRDLNDIVPPNRSAIDYVTMEPVLRYYSVILALRQKKNWNLLSHIASSSRLAHQIMQIFVLGIASFILLCIVFRLPHTHIGMMVVLVTSSILILWILYLPFIWKISADAVIKCFAAGFCIASSMAFFFESIVAIIVQTAVYVYIYVNNDGSYSANSAYYDDDAYSIDNHGSPFLRMDSGTNTEFSKEYPYFYLCFHFFQCFFVAAFAEELMKYLAFRMIASHADFWSRSKLEKVVAATSIDKEPIVDLSSLPKIEVEAQERSLQSRCLTNIFALVSIGIGFSCCETLVYSVVFKDQEIEVKTLLLRILLFSIHPVCAAWQAVGICRRDIELDGKYQLGMVLLPAVFWHGVIDFALIAGDFLLQNDLLPGGTDGMQFALKMATILLLMALISLIVACTTQQLRVWDRTEELLEGQAACNWRFTPGIRRKSKSKSRHFMPGYETETGVKITGDNNSIEAALMTGPVEEIRLPIIGNSVGRKLPSLLRHAYLPPELRGIKTAPADIRRTPSDFSSVSDSYVSRVPGAGTSYDDVSFEQKAARREYEAARERAKKGRKSNPGFDVHDSHRSAFVPQGKKESASETVPDGTASERGNNRSCPSKLPKDDADVNLAIISNRSGGLSVNYSAQIACSSNRLAAAMDVLSEAAVDCGTPDDHSSIGKSSLSYASMRERATNNTASIDYSSAQSSNLPTNLNTPEAAAACVSTSDVADSATGSIS